MVNYRHYHKSALNLVRREVVFGFEDGMVSTLGAVAGIAVGSGERDLVLLAGVVIIMVESVSMGVGAYMANLAQERTGYRLRQEERIEIDKDPVREKAELRSLFCRDGWPDDMAGKMTDFAAKDKKLMLKEMVYREHDLIRQGSERPGLKGFLMFLAYVGGGLIPLISFCCLPLPLAIYMAVAATLTGLFILGALNASTRHHRWGKAGLHFMLLGGISLAIGLLVGLIFNYW